MNQKTNMLKQSCAKLVFSSFFIEKWQSLIYQTLTEYNCEMLKVLFNVLKIDR